MANVSIGFEPIEYDTVLIHEAVPGLHVPIGTAKYNDAEWEIRLLSPWLMLEGTIKIMLESWRQRHFGDINRAWSDN